MKSVTQTRRHATYQSKIWRVLKKKWRTREMLGQCISSIDRQLFSEEGAFVWLSNGVTTAENERDTNSK
jgi:hypothetical protein